jgi:hypothetical protein
LPDVAGHSSLYDYSLAERFVPVRIQRWCTDKFKIRPLYAYFERPCEVLIGIDSAEAHRARDSRDKAITNVFPLVERGIDRQGCIEIIEAHGLPVPPKSGCYFCPFQRRSQWVELNRSHPDLWCKAVALDAASQERQREAGSDEMIYLADRPLDELVRAKDGRGRYTIDDQLDFFDDRRPCQCGL